MVPRGFQGPTGAVNGPGTNFQRRREVGNVSGRRQRFQGAGHPVTLPRRVCEDTFGRRAGASGGGAVDPVAARGTEVGPPPAGPGPTGRERITIHDVAAHAGVAISSVSRVLTGHPHVTPEMRRRVLAAAGELRYEPDSVGQSLRRGATKSIGLVFRDVDSPVISRMLLGAESALRRHGYSLMVLNSANLPKLDAENIGSLRRRRVDGLLLSVADEQHGSTVDQLANLRVPVVSLDDEFPARLRASQVLFDHAAGVRAAISYLLALGHRRIGLVTGPTSLYPGRARIEAARQMARRAPGLDLIAAEGAFTAVHGARGTQALMNAARPPTALIAANVTIFEGLLRVLRARGLAFPRDVSVVACDDVPLAELFDPPITTVWRDMSELCAVGCELLMEILSGGPRRTVVLPTRFIPRASCGPPPGP
jgi:LacI family transcriptional regulator